MFKSSSHINRYPQFIAAIALLSICAQSWVSGGSVCEQGRSSRLESSSILSCFQRAESAPLVAEECCCRATLEECCCAECDCAVSSPWVPSVPAIPTHGQSIGDLSLACCCSIFQWPRAKQIDSIRFRFVADDSIYKTARQTCVLLSRFTC